MRLHGASSALVGSLEKADEDELLAGHQAVAALIQAVGHVLGDGPLVLEFHTLVLGADHGRAMPAARARTQAALVDGWLHGLIESLTFDSRLKAEANAYAEARIKAERPVGFQS
jgi:hypothetical protein